MKTTHLILTIAITISLFWLNVYAIASDLEEEQKKVEAIMAAENFLLLVDTGQYGQSWDEASTVFQNQVSKEEWSRQIEAIRSSLGTLSKREIANAEYMTELPGAPDGHYVVIQYNSSFDKKQNGVETVTPMLDETGQWKVSGYYIK